MPTTDALDDTFIAPFIGSTLHLYTTAPTDETEGVEVVGGAYAAQATNLLQDAADSNVARNSDNIIFTDMPDCTVVAIGIKDSGGTLIYYDTLTSPKVVSANGIVTVATNTLTVTLG